MIDKGGKWPKWLTGTLNAIGGFLQAAGGIALGVAAGWTGVGAAAATLLIADGIATSTQGIGQVVNSISNKRVMREDNIIEAGARSVGKLIGGNSGAQTAGIIYNTVMVGVTFYAPGITAKKALQQAGLVPVRVNMSRVLNNPGDLFTQGMPKTGAVSSYCRSIPLYGYGKISVIQLPNGYFQLADGHHRVAALRSLGYQTIKVYITK